MRLRRPTAILAVLILALVCSVSSPARPRKPHHPHRTRTHRATVVAPATAPTPAPPAPVFAENQKSGTPDWLGAAATGRAAEVYASATDAAPGDRIALHVSTAPAARYRVLVYRLGWYGGIGAREVACLPACDGSATGTSQPSPPPDADGRVVAGWPATDTLTVDPSWVSGYYLVRVLLLDGPQRGASATTYVIVRGPASAHMLVQVPVNTWQAYNLWGGKSLYPFSVDGKRALRVSFDRPYDWRGTGAQGPLGWELPLVRFIERKGYDVAYQSDVYTDAHPESLLTHRVAVAAGHGEYWSGRMRDGWDAARDAGVRLAFLGANDAYWQVAMENGGRTVMSYKGPEDPNPDPRQKTTLFRALVPERRECDLMGVQHQGGSLGWSDGAYTLQPDAVGDPWLQGTGFRAGDTVPGIVSREVDAIPGGMTADYSCGNRLTVFFHRDLGGDGNADAVRYTAPSGSTVFSAGSLNFSWGLDDFKADPDMGHGFADARVQRFMDNAFTSMGAY